MARAAIITGADSGIGKASAVALARAGCAVGITYRSDERGAAEAAEEVCAAGQRAAVHRLDLQDAEAAVTVLDELVGELGGVDVLVNNAGTGADTPFLDHGLDEWRTVLDVDLTGAPSRGWPRRR